MSAWGCCTPGRTHPRMGGKVAQVKRTAASVVMCNLVAAPVALAARPCRVSCCIGSTVNSAAAWDKVPNKRSVHCGAASPASAAAAPGSHEEPELDLWPFPPLGTGVKWLVFLKEAVGALRAAMSAVLFMLAVAALPRFNKMPRSLGLIVSFIVIDTLIRGIYYIIEFFCNKASSLPLAKVQVAVLDPQRQLQQKLDKVVAKAYTFGNADPKLSIKQDTAKLLLENISSIVSGHLDNDMRLGYKSAESHFTQMCTEERAKVQTSTHPSTQEGRTYDTDISNKVESGQHQRELTVVTLLVAGKCLQSLPKSSTKASIGTMLGVLQEVTPDTIISSQVFWTPAEEPCTYSAKDLAADYPQMKAF